MVLHYIASADGARGFVVSENKERYFYVQGTEHEPNKADFNTQEDCTAMSKDLYFSNSNEWDEFCRNIFQNMRKDT